MTLNTQQNNLNDAELLLAQQQQAFLAAPPPTLKERQAKLLTLRNAVLTHRSAFEAAISRDFGNRSAYETALLEMTVVIQAIDYLRKNLRRFMRAQPRHVSLLYQPAKAYVQYQPLGVVGIMAPWNYPLALTLIPLATALAAGNRAMLKPSELTPGTSELLQQMLADTFATNEVAVVLGNADVGAAFSQLAFDHLFFTGSTEVGRKVMAAASANLVPVTLELGGKSPVVVQQGQVNRRTIDSIVFGKLANAGQTCVAPDYALVHQDDLDSFIEQYSAAVGRNYPQGPASSDYTSIVSERNYQRLVTLLNDAKSFGAKVIEVGNSPEQATNRPRTLAPTLVIDATDNSAIMTEEIFGPVLPIRTYQTMDEVINYINARPRPLALYYFGNHNATRNALLSSTTSGNVGINNTLLHVAQDDLPFGGVGASGIGAYHGIEGFRAMSHAKGVFSLGRWNLSRLIKAPYSKLADLALAFMLGRKTK
ncbi:coniferyl aldehyde dehydrogenase [Marinospirillum sp. MEB164]|uniref:Aldehyde dehydrogenase n=1 Tax=Marinospirillum alkalitolerans TaxID=3123374 RepID=A0ABW8PWT0_9GAMM